MTIKLNFILAFFAVLSSFTLVGQKIEKAVVFGDHSKVMPTLKENRFRVFMDMNGDFYPENEISNTDLTSDGNSQLRVWASAFPNQFSAIAQSYGLKEINYSEANFDVLQDSIVVHLARKLNKHPLGNNQTWLIHGFRKEYYKPLDGQDSTSFSDNGVVIDRINKLLAKKNISSPLYIEVYWDGKYQKRGRDLKTVWAIGKLYRDKAIPNGENCGYALRKLFSVLDAETVNVITHSTGTYLATSLLFNVYERYTTETPINENITVALMASASPGKKLFRNYYERNTRLNFKDRDNYRIINVLNRDDIVLRKMGFARRFGNTTLGCDFRGESKKLGRYFDKKFLSSTYLEISVEEAAPANHYLSRYVASDAFLKVVELLYY